MIHTITKAEFDEQGQLVALKGECKAKDLRGEKNEN